MKYHDDNTQNRAHHADSCGWNINGGPRLSAERMRDLLESYKRTGDVRVRNEAVEASMRLAVYVANRYRGRGTPVDDLVSVAAEALLEATETFDAERGASFTTYAVRCMEWQILKALGSKRAGVTVPARVRRQAARARRTIDSFYSTNGREPTPAELSEHITAQGGVPRAMHEIELTREPVAGFDVADAVSPDNTDEVAQRESVEKVRSMLGQLNPRAAMAVSLRFGLDHSGPRSWGEVAREMGVTPRKAEVLVTQALRMMRLRLAQGSSRRPSPREAAPAAGQRVGVAA